MVSYITSEEDDPVERDRLMSSLWGFSEIAAVTKQLVEIELVSNHLRECVHDINNALFVTKGFVEELAYEIRGEEFMNPGFDREGFREMFEAVARNVAKLDRTVQGLRDFVTTGIFQEPFLVGGGEPADRAIPALIGSSQPEKAKE